MDQTKYNEYVNRWCELLKIPPDAWALIEHLANDKKNYASCVAFMLQLEWEKYRPYLLSAEAALRDYCKQYSAVKITAADLYKWQEWWISENPLPK